MCVWGGGVGAGGKKWGGGGGGAEGPRLSFKLEKLKRGRSAETVEVENLLGRRDTDLVSKS